MVSGCHRLECRVSPLNDSSPAASEKNSEPTLKRGLGLWQATALNVANMVGIGPFVTIPLFLKAMGGPHALIAWIIAAVLVICDGLVWSELGAALPGSGGTYHFLKQIYGRTRWGRALPFLFIWQFLITGTLEIASGYIGTMQYVQYLIPTLKEALGGYGQELLSVGACVAVGLLLSRQIGTIGNLSLILCAGTILTVLIVICSGLTHFKPEQLAFAPGSMTPSWALFAGLAGSMQIAIYDYLGYYNVCHLGDEVREPSKTIPRAILISIGVIAATYLTMNISIIAVVPWQEAMVSEHIASDFMERLYGANIASAFTLLILWTSFACFFAITLGYSRILYAAARQGDFFSLFGHLHTTGGYPHVSLWLVTGLTALFCFFPLDLVVKSAVLGRIGVQFVGQIAGLHLLRKTRPDVALPFRMWLYPLPSLVALVGWLFVLLMKDAQEGWKPLGVAAAVNGSGVVAYFIWKQFPHPEVDTAPL